MAIGDATKFAAVAHVGLWHCASALDVRSHGRYRGKSRLGRFAKNDLDDPTATWAAHFIPLIWCRRFPAPPNGTLWNAGSDHSGLMLANLITFAHFSTSAARELDFKLPTPGLVDPFLGNSPAEAPIRTALFLSTTTSSRDVRYSTPSHRIYSLGAFRPIKEHICVKGTKK